MMKKTTLFLFACLLMISALPIVTLADDGPYVYAILFYSSECPHCHQLITEDLPPIQEQFGDQLRVVPLNTLTEVGNYLVIQAYEVHNVPESDWVVPMMIVGDTILISGEQITDELPGIVTEGLANGGIDLPDFPGMEEVRDVILEQYDGMQTTDTTDTLESIDLGELSITQRITNDPANMLAIVVLVGLIITTGVAIYSLINAMNTPAMPTFLSKIAHPIALFTVLAGIAIASTLALSEASDSLAPPLAWIVLIGLIVTFFMMMLRPDNLDSLIPLVSIIGIADAAYLSYVELTNTEATCGLVGNCNAVQASVYAKLFGILPIGVFGIMGYIVILMMYAWAKTGKPTQNIALANLGMFSAIVFGVVFSLYLTFLEPFVIGATCMWCIISALMMLVFFWITLPIGWNALQSYQSAKTT